MFSLGYDHFHVGTSPCVGKLSVNDLSLFSAISAHAYTPVDETVVIFL